MQKIRNVNKMNITAIICTFNREDTIIDCINSLHLSNLSGCELEIIIIDNNSTDNTVKKISDFIELNKKISIKLYRENNQGLAYARNYGIKKARGDFIFFLDDDALVDPNCISSYKFYYDRFGYECMGGKILPRSRYGRNFCFPGWFCKKYWGSLSLIDYGETPKRIFYPQLPFGTNWMIAKRLFEIYGRFNVDLGRKGANLISNEETEFMLRLEENDVPIHYIPKAVVFHLVPRNRLKKAYLAKRYFAQGVSDALMLSLRRGMAYTLRLIPKKFFEIMISPAGLIVRKIMQSESYLFPVFRVCFNFGFLWVCLQLLIQNKKITEDNKNFSRIPA